MANRLFHRLQSSTREVKTISGIISILGAASAANNVVTLLTNTGDYVASVARTGTGQYTITLADSYVALVSATFTWMAATAIDLVPQIVSHDVVTAKTIVVKALAGATATDTANTVQHYLMFDLKLKNTSVKN